VLYVLVGTGASSSSLLSKSSSMGILIRFILKKKRPTFLQSIHTWR
jgi:hypothetical protein